MTRPFAPVQRVYRAHDEAAGRAVRRSRPFGESHVSSPVSDLRPRNNYRGTAPPISAHPVLREFAGPVLAATLAMAPRSLVIPLARPLRLPWRGMWNTAPCQSKGVFWGCLILLLPMATAFRSFGSGSESSAPVSLDGRSRRLRQRAPWWDAGWRCVEWSDETDRA
jgi:hypothetical protein